MGSTKTATYADTVREHEAAQAAKVAKHREHLDVLQRRAEDTMNHAELRSLATALRRRWGNEAWTGDLPTAAEVRGAEDEAERAEAVHAASVRGVMSGRRRSAAMDDRAAKIVGEELLAILPNAEIVTTFGENVPKPRAEDYAVRPLVVIADTEASVQSEAGAISGKVEVTMYAPAGFRSLRESGLTEHVQRVYGERLSADVDRWRSDNRAEVTLHAGWPQLPIIGADPDETVVRQFGISVGTSAIRHLHDGKFSLQADGTLAATDGVLGFGLPQGEVASSVDDEGKRTSRLTVEVPMFSRAKWRHALSDVAQWVGPTYQGQPQAGLGRIVAVGSAGGALGHAAGGAVNGIRLDITAESMTG